MNTERVNHCMKILEVDKDVQIRANKLMATISRFPGLVEELPKEYIKMLEEMCQRRSIYLSEHFIQPRAVLDWLERYCGVAV